MSPCRMLSQDTATYPPDPPPPPPFISASETMRKHLSNLCAMPELAQYAQGPSPSLKQRLHQLNTTYQFSKTLADQLV